MKYIELLGSELVKLSSAKGSIKKPLLTVTKNFEQKMPKIPRLHSE